MGIWSVPKKIKISMIDATFDEVAAALVKVDLGMQRNISEGFRDVKPKATKKSQPKKDQE